MMITSDAFAKATETRTEVSDRPKARHSKSGAVTARNGQKLTEIEADSGAVTSPRHALLNEKTQENPGNSLVVRAGLEPATHGFSVRQRPNEIVDENEVHANRVQNRVQADQLPNIKAAENDLLSTAQRSIQASRSAIAKLLDATPLGDLHANAQLGPIYAELKTSEAILEQLAQRYND